MDLTLALEVSALIAVGFEFLKRALQGKFSENVGNIVFRVMLVAIALAYASFQHFYLNGHPEVVKVATQLALQAAGFWALIIKLVPNRSKPPTDAPEREAE